MKNEDMSVRCGLFACLLIGLILAASACSTGPEQNLTLHESPKGAVYLERVSDRAFQAAHPLKISQTTIALVLRGVLVRTDQGFLQDLKAEKSNPLRAFSDDDVAYLAPLISEGFSRAAPGQQIGFRVLQTGTPGYPQSPGAGVGSSGPQSSLASSESTSGVVYAYGRSLYLTLTRYRHRPETATTINMANRRILDNIGLANPIVMFTPESARRADHYRPADSTPSTLVIDYELLASLPAESGLSLPVQAAPAPTGPQPNSLVKGEAAQKDSEIEALRKELQEIKRQLAEQEAERIRSRPKEPASQK